VILIPASPLNKTSVSNTAGETVLAPRSALIPAFIGVASLAGAYGCYSGDPLQLCKAITLTGDETFYVPLLALVYAVYRGSLGISLVSSLVLASSSTVLLKVLIDSPRPPPSEWLVEASGPGFPSGHATLTAAFWTTVYALSRSNLLLFSGALHTLAVSYSRVALGVHYWQDVIGGLLVGSLSALAVYLYTRGRPSLPEVPLVFLASALMSLAAALMDPSYDSPAKLLGLSIGSLAGYAIVIKRYSGHLEAGSPAYRVTALALVAAAVSIPVTGESAGTAWSAAILALYAFLVALSRPAAAAIAGWATKRLD